MTRIVPALAASALLAGAALPAQAQTATVEVRMTGAVTGGPVMIQLCTEAEFMRRCAFEDSVQADADGVAVARFTGVAPGRYAAGGYQDVNSNGRIDFGGMGPIEPWGYSRDAPAVMGPPVFSDAVVDVPAGPMVIPVRLGGI
jgi:uncharacterized protein (DUF2141 family)